MEPSIENQVIRIYLSIKKLYPFLFSTTLYIIQTFIQLPTWKPYWNMKKSNARKHIFWTWCFFNYFWSPNGSILLHGYTIRDCEKHRIFCRWSSALQSSLQKRIPIRTLRPCRLKTKPNHHPPFYSLLIKNWIFMLNKKKSASKNLWKILPILTLTVLFAS